MDRWRREPDGFTASKSFTVFSNCEMEGNKVCLSGGISFMPVLWKFIPERKLKTFVLTDFVSLKAGSDYRDSAATDD